MDPPDPLDLGSVSSSPVGALHPHTAALADWLIGWLVGLVGSLGPLLDLLVLLGLLVGPLVQLDWLGWLDHLV
jgi:hypothetical protein